jgi:hypothetical protein
MKKLELKKYIYNTMTQSKYSDKVLENSKLYCII